MIKELQYVSHLDLNLGSLGHSHQWRRFQYNSSICLPLVMGLNQLPQREFPSLAPAAWRPGSQVCGCSAPRFAADCNGLSVTRIRFKWRLKFGSSSHPLWGYKISWAMLTCGNLSSLPTSVCRIAHLHLLPLFLKSLSKGCGSWSHAFLTTHLIHEILCHNQTNHSYQKQMWQKELLWPKNSAANGELLNLVLPGDWGDWRVKTHVPRLEVFQRISRGGRMSCWRDVMRKSWDVVRSPVEGCCTLCLSKLRYPIRTFIRTWLQYIEHDEVWK